jgi:ABC-2 type transport system permease protein
MHRPDKLFIVAASEASMAVRSKAFIIGMMLVPVFMGVSIALQRISQNQADLEERRFAVIDASGVVFPSIAAVATDWNNSVAAKDGGRASGPRMVPELTSGGEETMRSLVQRVKRKELKAFVEIPAGAVQGDPAARVRYYSNAAMDNTLPRWLENTVNRAVLNERFRASGVDRAEVMRLTRQVGLTRLDLPSWDERGVIKETGAIDPVRALGVPMGAMILLLFVVVSSAPGLLNSVLEEKLSRTNEVMLGSVSPMEFMGGKLLAAAGVSMAVSAVYLTAAFVVARNWGYVDVISPRLVASFVLYALLGVLLFGSIFISIGAACNEIKDTQTMMMPAMMLVMLPMFTWSTILRAPTSTFAIAVSLFPTATPFLMLPLTTIPPGPPLWQQAAGITLSTATMVLFVWAAGRIFRVGLLMQGKSATFADMMRWVKAG